MKITLSLTLGYSLVEKKMKSLFTLFVALMSLLSLAACQTVQGAGRDIQRAGEALEDAVD